MDIKKELWIIYDEVDGPHLFFSKKKAEVTLERWKRQAIKDNDLNDTVWDMSEPIRYILENGQH